MTALIFASEFPAEASNGGDRTQELCIDSKVHVTCSVSWYDQSGDEANACNSTIWSNFRPCDGKCRQQTQDLPGDVAAQVTSFLATGSAQDVTHAEWLHPEDRAELSQEETPLDD